MKIEKRPLERKHSNLHGSKIIDGLYIDFGTPSIMINRELELASFSKSEVRRVKSKASRASFLFSSDAHDVPSIIQNDSSPKSMQFDYNIFKNGNTGR